MNLEIYRLAKKVAIGLKKQELRVATAESCTGGLLAASFTDVSGSSDYFDRGYIVYSNFAKHEDLGVKNKTLEEFGAVSEEVAIEMAKGVLKKAHAQIGIAITGIAGPGGGLENKPVGTVCFSIVCLKSPLKTVAMHFKGNRNSIRIQAVRFVLEFLLEIL